MIFGDGAAAMVIGPAAAAETGDVQVVQTYASGPHSEVNSIIWPNPEFDNDITVYGPEVKSLVQRYLTQMLDELGAGPDPDDPGRTLLDSIELIVPHQANKTMILNLAGQAGLSADQLYFNVERMGNVSAASIPIAIHDAVRDGVITRPTRIFAPGFGAGAVGGYAVMRIDPAIVADEVVLDVQEARRDGSPPAPRADRGAPPMTCARRSASDQMSQPTRAAFQRLAIVNRGEPAMRLINAVREWNAEGRPALRVIAVYTAADRHAMFVREADEAVLIGPADPGRGRRSRPAPISTTPSWSGRCGSAGPTRSGPAGGSSRRRPSSRSCATGWGSRSSARRPRSCAGSATRSSPSGWPSRSACRSRRGAAARWPTWSRPASTPKTIGYPLMVKATAGGGGRGIRLVGSAEELAEAFERASSEASKTAGDATVFLERAIRGGRHVEVQVIADADGTVWTLGVRDCSVQRRNQKVIEESASTALDAEQEQTLRSYAAEPGPGGRLRQRRHRGVPLRAQGTAAVVPGGQHPAAGRAPGHRGDHRHRHRQAAAAHRGGRASWPMSPPPRRRCSGTPSRPGSPPRTRSAASRPRRAGSSTWRCPPAPASGSTPGWPRATSSRRSSTP